MVITAYLNSNILKQEEAISIEEEAIKAKKAALNLRKAINRKVVRAIKNIREAIEKYPEYLEIIKKEFTNTKIDNQKEKEKITRVKEPKNKATETKKISNPESEIARTNKSTQRKYINPCSLINIFLSLNVTV